ncbi:hypothetical protein [Methylobacterium pseudosasicola]|uniref:Outer membrane immunogenic protein n=1 Tax=Methylobacterium pseudosasicola TaxID=582667 RepID=A0A1I4JGZ8_9HYPH|nr:hypothetical protein [Methylobacterium pseudosasicola]SFL65477.1 hypothetical protein SAMN05192568_100837 [Methylobacterium pseudosasicola]
MRRLLMPIILFALASAPVRAEDFSGFYAGVNAGYALGNVRDRSVGIPGTEPGAGPGRTGTGPDLPPSARDAAAGLQRSSRGSSAAGR